MHGLAHTHGKNLEFETLFSTDSCKILKPGREASHPHHDYLIAVEKTWLSLLPMRDEVQVEGLVRGYKQPFLLGKEHTSSATSTTALIQS